MRDRLVERAMGGDQAAFSALAADAVDGCYRLAYRILRDPHRAQDATQQALLAAWRDLPTLRDPSRFDAWLHRLVIHACYAEARSDRRWVARVRAISNQQWRAPRPARGRRGAGEVPLHKAGRDTEIAEDGSRSTSRVTAGWPSIRPVALVPARCLRCPEGTALDCLLT